MVKENFLDRVTDDNYMIENDNGEMVPNYDLTIINFNEGDILKGKVVKIDKDEVLIDIGYKSEGVIPLNELSIRNSVKPDDVLKIEDVIEIMVLQKEDQDGRLILSKRRAEMEQSFDRVQEIYESGGTIEGEVIECVRGGLILDIGLRGFLPASLIDVRKTRELAAYIGEKCVCKIIEVDRNRNNVVLSRKAIIEDERKEQRKEALDSIEIGQIRKGVITSIADFGAFVDIDGVDGLVHISELSWNHVKHPSEVVSIDDEVSVEVLDIDNDKQRLSLGLKQTQKDPWVEKIKKYKVNDVVTGKATRIVKFGLFVQIEEGMEGLVHISELSVEPISRPSEVAKIGDELEIRIIDIDFDKRRMAFSVKQVANPVSEEEREEKSKGKEAASKKKIKPEEIKEKVSKSEEKKSEPVSGKGKKAAPEDKESKEKKPEDKILSKEKEELDKKLGGISQEEKEQAIKKILKELKEEANIE